MITYAGNRAAADTAVAGLRETGATADLIQADAADSDSAHAVVDKARVLFSNLDILVLNAGIAEYASVAQTEESVCLDVSRRHRVINVTAVVALTTATLALLRDGGRIIITGSVNAHQMPFPGVRLYGASKAAAAAWRVTGHATSSHAAFSSTSSSRHPSIPRRTTKTTATRSGL